MSGMTDQLHLSEDADADVESYEHHRKANHDIQAACDAVLAAGVGEDRAAILQRLREELESRGHWPQPRPWLDAVVAEVQQGRHYRVSIT